MPKGRVRSSAPPITRRRFGALAASILLAPIIAACSGGDDKKDDKRASSASPVAKEPKKVTFMAGFQPQANLPFVGAYVAAEKGFFKEQALDVDIRHAQSGEHLQLMLAGEVQFSTANGSQVLARNGDGLPIVSIALIGQRSEQGFAVLANSGIKTVKDWAGKTFGYKGSPPAEFFAVAKANGLDANSVKQVRVSFDPRVLSEGQVDILAVFFSNEPDTLASIGFPTRVFDPNEFGLQSLGLTYVASRDYVAKDPDATERFLKAALKGIDYANQNRDEALDIVLKYAPQQERNHQRFMLNTELDRSITDLTKANGFGWQTRDQWQQNHDMLFEYGVLKQRLDISQVYNDTILKQIYDKGHLKP